MKLPVNKHEDNRRTLVEWIANFPITTCKVIEMKEDGELGNHYHKHKQDFFYLLKGKGGYEIGEERGDFNEGDCLTANIGEPHTIILDKGSILLEASTTPYNKEDEIQILK
jgi:mannose-6-phosphate isomerase-like protein (cupin superfamily)